MYYGKHGNNQISDLGDTELVDYLEGNTWINSGLLDPPPPSDLANKSKKLPTFGNNRYLQMFMEATTYNLWLTAWEQMQPMQGNLMPEERKSLEDL